MKKFLVVQTVEVEDVMGVLEVTELKFKVILASIYYYHQCQKAGTPVDFKIVGLLGIGFITGAYFGSKIALSIDEELLKKIFAIILFYTAIKMLNWDAVFVKWVRQIF